MEYRMTFDEEQENFLRMIDFALSNISEVNEEDKTSYRNWLAEGLSHEDSMLYHDSPFKLVAARCVPEGKLRHIPGQELLGVLEAVGAILYQGMEEEPGVLKEQIDVVSIKSQIASLFDSRRANKQDC